MQPLRLVLVVAAAFAVTPALFAFQAGPTASDLLAPSPSAAAAGHYDPGARRDPFLPPRSAAALARPSCGEGVASLEIGDLRLQGIFQVGGEAVAQVSSDAQRTSFLLRQGDELCDGSVSRVDLAEIDFRQSVSDPGAIKPFRIVALKLD